MNKKLISLAVASVLAAPFVAHADEAPTVYGQLHMIYGQVQEKTDGTTKVDNWQVRSYDSRLGFKGTRDFGDGLMGVYQIELGVNPDSDGKGKTDVSDAQDGSVKADSDGTAGLSRRNMYVGLKGGWGELRVGRHDTPLKMSQGKFDQFGDTDADFKHAGSQDAETRMDNMLLYLGKTGAIGYNIAVAPGEDSGTGSTANTGPADTVSLAVSYDNGPIYLAVAQDKYANAANASSDSMTRLTGTYRTGGIELGLLYQKGVEAPAASSKEETWTGLSFGMNLGGNNKLKAQYVTTEDNAASTKTEGTLTAVGFDHKFDKKTTGYVMYTKDESTKGSSKSEDTVFGAGMLLKF